MLSIRRRPRRATSSACRRGAGQGQQEDGGAAAKINKMVHYSTDKICPVLRERRAIVFWRRRFVRSAWCLGSFPYDDKLRSESAAVQGAWPGWKFWLGFVYGDGEYEPLVFSVHWVLRRFSDGVFPLRLTSLLLHAANAFLAWRLLRRVLGDERRAFWSAVLFSLFPAHVETIALSTFKKHLLVGFFGLGLLNVQLERRLGAGVRIAAVLGLQAAALLSRESAVILPWLSLWTAWSAGGMGEIRRNASLHAGLFAVAGLYGLGRVMYLPHAAAALAGENWFWHLATSGKIFLWDLRQLALPAWLGLEHSLRPVQTGREAALIGTACLGRPL